MFVFMIQHIFITQKVLKRGLHALNAGCSPGRNIQLDFPPWVLLTFGNPEAISLQYLVL